MKETSTVRPTEDICRANVVVEVAAQVVGLCTGPWSLLDFFGLSAVIRGH
jgi:hypothetical protein